MPSDVLSSNFDLLNIGPTTRRSLFARRNRNERQGAASSSKENLNSIFPAITRRRTKTSQTMSASTSQSAGAAADDDAPFQSAASLRSNVATSCSVVIPRFGGPGRSSSSSSSSTAAAAISQIPDTDLTQPPLRPRLSSSSSITKKRKRPLPQPTVQTRSSSNASNSSRPANMRHRERAPSSQISVASSSGISPSDSDSSLSSIASRRTSKSSLSLKQGLDDMLLTSHTQSPLSSPTAAKVLGDRSCSRKSSRTQKQPFPTEHSSDEEDGSLGRDHARLTSPSETEASTEQDEMWLNSAPASQLERLNKATLVRLALGADISTGGMTKAQIIQSILSFRSSSFSRRVSTASARSCSADYTDESEDERTNYERGHEGGDEETEAERPAHDISKRRRRPTRGTVVGSANVRSPIRRTTRNSRDTRHSELTLGLPTDAVMTAASPMLNRLRKQRSLHFASPVRARTRARATARPVAPLPLQDFSPLKPRPRLAKAKATMQSQHDPHSTSDGVEKMDEDWVDDVSADPKRRNTRARGRVQRVAKIEASKSLVDPSDSEMDEDLDSSDALTASSETGSASEAAVDADLESDEESEEDADETATEVNSKSATPTGIDDYVDSDATDTPQGPKIRSGRKASPSSPSKIRRLRNGKLRLTPNGEIADNTDVEVESQLEARPLISLDGNHLRNRKKSNASSSGAKAPTKDDVATPKLSSGNDEARTAEPEHIDELNGLDLESLNLTDKEIPARQLSKTSKIGSGGFKDVFVGVWRVGKRRNKVAIADIREKLTEMDIKELGLLRDLKHENIVRFIGVSIPEDTHRTGIPCMIVSELCSNGDLWDYIRNVKPPSNLDIFRMLLETARGLEYLHMHSIVHRDVKSSNVLVTRNRSCKINDFGLARVKKSQRSKMHSVVGTVNWQAVELWCAMPQYNEKVDVWSTAMTFWEVLQWHEEYQSYPFEGMNEFMIYEEVGKKGLRPSLESIVPRYGEEIAKLLTKMWEADPRKRPTMDMVCADLEHLIETKKIELGA